MLIRRSGIGRTDRWRRSEQRSTARWIVVEPKLLTVRGSPTSPLDVRQWPHHPS